MRTFLKRVGSWLFVIFTALLPVGAAFVVATTPVVAQDWSVLGFFGGANHATSAPSSVPAEPAKAPEPLPPAPAEAKLPPNLIVAIDGDTVRSGGTVYRLKGFDAPETKAAKCDAERRLGQVAQRRLTALLMEAHTEIASIGGVDRYGRTLASLVVARGNAKTDVADLMIAEGLAVSFDGKSKRRAWCASK